MVLKISGGGNNIDYTIVTDDIVKNIKQFENSINLLTQTYNGDINFFYFYLINILNDLHVITVNDIFYIFYSYIVNYYIHKIIKYYESYMDKNANDHLIRIQNEFNILTDLKTSLLKFLNALNHNNKDSEKPINQIKSDIIKKLKGNKFKQIDGFKSTKFNVNLSITKIKKNKNTFQYLCELLNWVVSINNQYLEYFKEYSTNTEHNINEIYNLTNQLLI